MSSDTKTSDSSKVSSAGTDLSPLQTLLASFFLLAWLFLFAGGITMDTTPFRCAISPDGASKLAAEAQPSDPAAKEVCKKYEQWMPVGATNLSVEGANAYKVFVAWLGLLLFFLPLNLAMVSSAAGALGAIGNKANLEHDSNEQEAEHPQATVKSVDTSSPIISGLLRGVFVYLFFISGLLLFDDKPFSSPGPGQYIRLAGFISLISFLVNYRPHLSATIFDWAYERINSRKVVPTTAPGVVASIEETRGMIEKTKLEVKTPGTNGGGEEKPATQPADAALKQ